MLAQNILDRFWLNLHKTCILTRLDAQIVIKKTEIPIPHYKNEYLDVTTMEISERVRLDSVRKKGVVN